MKEIHFYTCTAYIPDHIRYYSGWDELSRAIGTQEIIHTTQMGQLSTSLLIEGYKIFIHDNQCDPYEIKLWEENERTTREIRPAHNLFAMWKNGVFDCDLS